METDRQTGGQTNARTGRGRQRQTERERGGDGERRESWTMYKIAYIKLHIAQSWLTGKLGD